MKTKYLMTMFIAGLLIGTAFSATKINPDLIIKDIKIDTSTVNKNNKITVIYTIKNVGKTKAPASIAKIDMKANGKTITATPTTPTIDPGGSYKGVATFTAASKNNYIFNLTADYNNGVLETNEKNNSNTASFSFGKKF